MMLIDYIKTYLENRGVCYKSAEEHEKVVAGIIMYLKENGTTEREEREYFIHYIDRHLKKIDDKDLKDYFANYEILSDVNQLVIEGRGKVFDEIRKKRLLRDLTLLEKTSLMDKYVPVKEIANLLGGE